jgi:2-oxoglutarate ferredoxin oxidoreductase subunit alpha
VPPASLPPGLYRDLSGGEALGLGLLAAAERSGLPLLLASYPITPASDVLHFLSRQTAYGVRTFQAEDEIAAMGAAIGAAFGGCLALTGTSGPGLALKSEALGLAVMTELPVCVVNVQRGGPSTGLPTKTEQADLFQALFGRSGECPLAVLAASSPADCFDAAIEAARIALAYMTPVILLTDGCLANAAEPWRVVRLEELPVLATRAVNAWNGPFLPYQRDPATLARPWATPGTPGLEHRIGGLEKSDIHGNVSYDPLNHEKMVRLRAEKIERIANDLPPAEIFGDPSGELLVVGWGGTRGAIVSAVEEARAEGLPVSSLHLRHLHPLAPNVGEALRRFRRVLVAELNLGQCLFYLRGRFGVEPAGLHKVQGQPFKVREVLEKIRELCHGA